MYLALLDSINGTKDWKRIKKTSGIEADESKKVKNI